MMPQEARRSPELQYPRVDLVLGQGGVPMQVNVVRDHALMPSMPRVQQHVYITDDMRRRIGTPPVPLCPHHASAARLPIQDNIDAPPDLKELKLSKYSVGGQCRQPGCTMRFWVEIDRETSTSWVTRHRTDNLYLRVEQCRLRLPLAAEDEEWMACSND